jgi:putative transposase
LLGLSRASYYHQPQPETPETFALLRRIDELYLAHPFYGSRRIAHEVSINRKRAQRLMRLMGIEAHYPKPRLSQPAPGHLIFPYLLRGLAIERPNQVWSGDITYLPQPNGFFYLVAIMDWFSRYVLSWELSNSLEGSFCRAAAQAALRHGQPEIWNSDQGAQFTAPDFVELFLEHGVAISMDGRGRALDNVFIERLWRSIKYECVYLGDFVGGSALRAALGDYFPFYNERRPHQALDYATPAAVYRGR